MSGRARLRMTALTALKALAAMAALGGGPAMAQSSAVEAELRRCRAVADAGARMACYDAIALPDATPQRAAQAAGATPVAAASAPTPAAPAAVAAPAVPAAPNAPNATSAAAAASASSAALRQFGLPERPVAQVLQSVESVIEGDFDGWTAGARLRLANGQVWEIVDGSTASYRLRDPKVRITRGLLGSFFMSIEGVAQSPRVRRIQ